MLFEDFFFFADCKEKNVSSRKRASGDIAGYRAPGTGHWAPVTQNVATWEVEVGEVWTYALMVNKSPVFTNGFLLGKVSALETQL